MKKIFLVLAVLAMALLVQPALMAQTSPADTATVMAPSEGFGVVQQWIDFFKAYAPWLIVIGLTQILKVKVFKKLTDWLGAVLSVGIPFILSAGVWLIFGLPGFDLSLWIKNSFSCWVLALWGFDILKAIANAAKKIIQIFKDSKGGG